MRGKVKLGDVLDITSGFAFDSSMFSRESGIPLVRIRDVVKGETETRFKGKYEDRYLVQDGDILIGMDGQFNRARWRGGEALLNQRVCRVKSIHPCLDETYLYYFLPSPLRLLEESASFVTVKHLSVKEIREIEIPFPPFAEQKRIAAILEKADALRAKRRKALEQLDALAQAIFIEMFGEPVTNSKGLALIRLSEFGVLERGVSKHRPRNDPSLLGGEYPLIQTSEVANCDGYITAFQSTYSEKGLAQSRLWPSGTLCITIAANIAKAGILSFEACFPDSVVGFWADSSAKVRYVQFWLSFLQKNLERNAPASAQKNINLEVLRNLTIPLPTLTDMQLFESRLQQVERAKELMKSAYREYDALFSSLQHRAFRGEL